MLVALQFLIEVNAFSAQSGQDFGQRWLKSLVKFFKKIHIREHQEYKYLGEKYGRITTI